MGIRVEVLPFLVVAVAFGLLVAIVCRLARVRRARAAAAGAVLGLILGVYFLFFFRDPPRTPPSDPSTIVAGADGKIASIVELSAEAFRQRAAAAGLKPGQLEAFPREDVVRISIFLSLFDVHVNRAPISGSSTFLGYFPGRHFFTFQDKSSDYNQHNSILIENARTCCLFNQIVGPVARRVVYWPDPTRPVPVKIGDRLGMMKFGSRLDMYFPKKDVTVTARAGERVRAGETVIARLTQEDIP